MHSLYGSLQVFIAGYRRANWYRFVDIDEIHVYSTATVNDDLWARSKIDSKTDV